MFPVSTPNAIRQLQTETCTVLTFSNNVGIGSDYNNPCIMEAGNSIDIRFENHIENTATLRHN